tara:strand:+ start:13098 stop:13463 length:366 start_codon:yes stop_codon:yes gene_type:complete
VNLNNNKKQKRKKDEKTIQREIKEFLNKNHFSIDVVTISIYGQKGMADLVGCAPDGRFVSIEVKAEGGKLTRLQERWLQEKQKRNAIAFMAYDVDDVKSILKHYGYTFDEKNEWLIKKVPT